MNKKLSIPSSRRFWSKGLILFGMFSVLLTMPLNLSAHCDSYDGPLIKEALKAIDKNNVTPMLKWVQPKYEAEIKDLFAKTVSLKGGDKVIYNIVEKHFLETLVRLHREGEGAPFTGLKPAGSASKITLMADNALAGGSVDDLAIKLKAHVEKVVRDKFDVVMEKSKNKDKSIEQGREYVEAYVTYVHLLEAIEGNLAGSGGAHAGHE